jgi:putative molybdopterin biosynthesis protein
VRRPEGAGAPRLVRHVLDAAKIRLERLTVVAPPAVTESKLAVAILDGKADAGIALRAVAHYFRLDFVPLRWERFDLAIRRRDYFEPPVQKLLGFARSVDFAEKAAVLGGYDIGRVGGVSYNA